MVIDMMEKVKRMRVDPPWNGEERSPWGAVLGLRDPVVADDERQGVVVRGHMGRVGTVPRMYRAPGTPLDSHVGMKAPGGADLHFIPKIKHSVTTKE